MPSQSKVGSVSSRSMFRQKWPGEVVTSDQTGRMDFPPGTEGSSGYSQSYLNAD